jgi:hypothetical protein
MPPVTRRGKRRLRTTRKPLSQRKPVLEQELFGEWNDAASLPNTRKTRRTLVGYPYGKTPRERVYISRPMVEDERTPVIVQTEIAEQLRKNRVYVPRILGIDSEYGIIKFEQGGTTLRNWIYARRNRFGPQTQRVFRGILQKWMRALSRAELAGIAHNHPHVRNTVLNKNQIGFIDLSQSEKVTPDWRDAQSVIQSFNRDWIYASEGFVYFYREIPKHRAFFENERKRFFSNLLKQYPCTPTVRQQIANHFRDVLCVGLENVEE